MNDKLPPLNATELMVKLGLGRTRFHHYRKLGYYRHLEIKRPKGQRRYARKLVEQYLAGQSTTQIGGRA